MLKKAFFEVFDHFDFFQNLLIEHLQITLISALISLILGLSIGILISEKRQFSGFVISIVNIVYTIPSIALLGFLISVTGIGNVTAIIALSVYGLLPIVRSTYMGITSIDKNIIEASEAMGSKKIQTLWQIKLPLAFPVIFSAIRDMVIMTIALAGIASFVGAGGLGVAIYRGITTNNETLIFAGSAMIALLALIIDFVLGLIQKRIESRNSSQQKNRSKSIIWVFLSLIILGLGFSWFHSFNQKNIIRIASKPTTESYILAEIMKKYIEEHSDLKAEITHGVGGGTSNIHPALLNGEFDMYPEYTGTAWQIVLKEKAPYTDQDFEQLKEKYTQNYNFSWLGMFGFNNTYSLGVRKEIADRLGLKTFSDLSQNAQNMIFGAEYDFFEREDGFKALSDAYNFKFKKAIDMDNGLKYKAMFSGKIDVMTVFTTDGQISNPQIVTLTDDKSFYPKYMAGIVVRNETLEKYPELKNLLNQFNHSIDEKNMAELNKMVETSHISPKNAAKYFFENLWKK
ncbi:ABC transporter permease subunit [Ornithobacterium rhinotracheale]|uniref:ABC transporter permease/substrate-binding protein n=1 Tax=Ornithobacterium rhinotracheale TaxID=28251 RepID=UPI00129D0887|nr:ABC transporter permease/substrate-binding protein [Ornithobacterium rhinotracheale]MRJ08779.1 ABC transporter permease subunit [Ornithobacterium rhinotracheale]UOH77077.1 ABC transporter permease/substrate-binding protein [Ornithobacterium rhinotracheale]